MIQEYMGVVVVVHIDKVQVDDIVFFISHPPRIVAVTKKIKLMSGDWMLNFDDGTSYVCDPDTIVLVSRKGQVL
jgi:hypothetical protein